MSRTDSADLEILANPASKHFLDEIASAHLFVTHDQIVEFFRLVLSHFSNPDLDVACGKEILRAICKILSISDFFLKAFIDNKFAPTLPFGNRKYLDDILDVLYVLVYRDPRVFDENLASQFGSRIKNRGEKSLMLICFYAQRFNEVDNPWPMLDLLFSESARFSKEDIAGQYAMLLSTLVQTYPEFRRARGEAAWTNVCALLSIEKPEVLMSVYNACCGITANVKRCRFPFEWIKVHFAIEALMPYVLSFLLIANLEFEELRDKVFVKSVVRVAHENRKGALALMRLAQDKAIAQALVEDCTWMEEDLPSLIDTLRVFLIVFQHKPLRTMIAGMPEFIVFLSRLTNEQDENLYAIVAKILRRIDLDEEIIGDLSNSCFLQEYIDAADTIGKAGAWRAAILVLDKIAHVAYTRELLKSCDMLVRLIKTNEEVMDAASTVATTLCTYKRCAKKFRELGMIEYFKKLYKVPETKKIAARFLNAIGDD